MALTASDFIRVHILRLDCRSLSFSLLRGDADIFDIRQVRSAKELVHPFERYLCTVRTAGQEQARP